MTLFFDIKKLSKIFFPHRALIFSTKNYCPYFGQILYFSEPKITLIFSPPKILSLFFDLHLKNGNNDNFTFLNRLFFQSETGTHWIKRLSFLIIYKLSPHLTILFIYIYIYIYFQRQRDNFNIIFCC